ncbi:MAG: hypothetical protein ACRC7G_10340 [Beijerinckiaceae bacterium]
MAVLAVLAAGCSATGSDHPLRGPASAVGWATSVGEPKDFVKARRQQGELAYVPVGREAVVRPIASRNAAGAKDLEAELDRTRNQSEAFARRTQPGGAYGAPLPSVAEPARPASATADRPRPGGPESFPVNPNRLRQMRDSARQVTP